MLHHRILPRLAGSLVAVAVLVVGAQLLLLSFEATPLVDNNAIDDVTGWINRRPPTGVALLGGMALVAVAIWFLWATIRSNGPERRVITTRRDGGWTKLDLARLEDAIERHLDPMDRRADVTAKVERSGRVDLKVITTDPFSTTPVDELRDTFAEFCHDRSLPCRLGRITVSRPRRVTSRRRVQ